MNKKFVTMIIALAVAVTGITVPADKAKAETVPETTEAPTQAPTATPYPTPNPNLIASTVRPYTPPTPAPATAAPTNPPVSTPEPKPVKKQDSIAVLYSMKSRVKEGETLEVTKGYDTILRIKVSEGAEVKWTSSNPKVVSIKNTKNKYVISDATISAKKKGKSVITAEYGGYKTSITVKVAKNEYKGRNDNYSVNTSTYTWGKFKGKKGPLTVRYDKKGNLRVKYTEKHYAWTKQKKVKIVKATFGMLVDMKYKGKTIIDDKYIPIVKEIDWRKAARMSYYSPKKQNSSLTFTIPKKYLKKKKMDLRKCSFWITTGGGRQEYEYK